VIAYQGRAEKVRVPYMSNRSFIATCVNFAASWALGYSRVAGWKGAVVGCAFGAALYFATARFIVAPPENRRHK
jgi:hypothetical protein